MNTHSGNTPVRITPEIARLARRAGCPPARMFALARRHGLVHARYAVEMCEEGVIVFDRGRRGRTSEWRVQGRILNPWQGRG